MDLRRGRQAFLLVEATLTTVIIAVALVFISRGMAGSLTTLSRLRDHDRMLRLAKSQLSQLELDAQRAGVPAQQEADFASPDEAYHWRVTSEPASLGAGELPPEAFRLVNILVRRADGRGASVQVTTAWPSSWLVSE